jgi:uncharacterized protein YbaP (TraB family)
VIPHVAQGPAFLWKVHKGDGPTLWLYGTVHDIGITGVPPVALAALDGSRRFASELGDGDLDPETLRDLSRYKSGPGIDQTLPIDDWYDLRDTLAGTIKEDALRRARPWYALILLNKKVAPNKPTSMDVDLGKRAKSRKLPVDALETWKEQMTALDAVVTVADLSESIRARHAMRCDVGRLGVAYKTGDLELLSSLLLVPRTSEELLWKRNRAWLPKLEAYLAPAGGGAFVAVGLGHMLGEQGLPALLARAGYTVERTP